MMIFVIIVFYVAVAFLEITPLKRAGDKKKIALYSLVLFAAFAVSLLIAFGVKLPSINRAIGDLILSITGGK